ncbi:MAG: cytochrome bc1 complex cytochrome b subunit [Actinomycetes bacterium]|jgi:ubiquinol-cytochrome c reductase cytochrome b subunit
MSSTVEKAAGGVGNYFDERVRLASASKALIRKVFPEHWSFLLGEIALWSFVVLLLTGTWLTFFFKPSMVEVVYDGSYQPLQGVRMSEAYASTLDISFDIRGGMIMRQIHHWAALIFVAAICIHLLRIFFTGAFRKPRELNWIIGNVLLTLALLEGFAGYSLPDDLLSGTGLRIAEGVLLSIPLVGTYASFFLFGGEFPGEILVPRLFTIHILLIPALILALVTVHLLLVFAQKHTQWPGPGKTEKNVIGYPFLPVYMAKTGGFFFIVFGVCALLGGLAQVNPIWLYGPYNPAQVSAGSQPDWYIGFLEGALRAMPNWEITAWGHTLSLNVLIPSLIVPGIFFTVLALYPFVEQWVTGDKREHHLLQRPRNVPVRTGLGAAGITFYGILWLNGGNDVIARQFQLSLNEITWFSRVFIFVGPVAAYLITKRICLGLARRDREKVLHGRETGIIRRMPSGEYIEVHEPAPAEERFALTAHEVQRPHELGPAVDENGIPNPNGRKEKVRATLSRWYFGDRVEKPTAEEYQAITSGHDHH